MPDFLANLFDSSGFMPRRQCGHWSADLIWIHIGSDALIWLAYMTIPLVLTLFVRRRRDLPFPWIFWMFGAFISTCGVTHFLEAAAFYWPAYRLMAAIKLITAVTSWATVVGVVAVFPRALSLLSLEGLRKEFDERKRVEQARHQSEERLRLALEAVSMGTWDWDLLTNEVVWSDNLEAIFGLSPGRFDRTFDGFRKLVLPSDWEHVERTIARSIEERSQYEIEHRIIRTDGSIGWISGRGKVFNDSDGGPTRMIGIAMDITVSKRAEQDLRDYAERLEVVSRRVVEVQEAERRHIARELHDEIGQILSTICVNLHAARGVSAAAAWPRLDECLDIVDRAVHQVRGLSLDLRPSMLDDLGLVAALRWLVDRQAQHAGVVVHFVVKSSGATLPPAVAIACYRVAQEALTNIVRHAQAKQVWFELGQDDEEVVVIVRDDGIGFDPEEAIRRGARGESLGLLGIQERTGLLRGLATIGSAPGRGTTITIRFPLTSAPASDSDAASHGSEE